MDTGIVISLILGLASIISSIFYGLVPSIRKEKFEKQKRKIAILLKDIDSFYAIETELIKRLSEDTGKSQDGIKRDVRKYIRDQKQYSISDFSTPSRIKEELTRIDSL